MVLRRRLVLWFAVPLVLRAGVVSAMPQEAVFNTPPADRLAIVRGAPQSLRAVEQNGSVFVSIDELLASLGWTRCGARCAIAPGSAGGPRRWTLSPGSVAAVQNEDFANVRDLEALFGVKAGWDRFDNYVWVVGGDALPPPSREGPNIPIPSKNYGPFDAAGIPMKDHGAAGIQYNPLVVLEYSTVYFRNYLDTGEDKYRAAFFRMIDWLRGSAVPVAAAPQTAAWYYEFDWPPFARGPFLAGITQAYAGSAFVDSYNLSGDEK